MISLCRRGRRSTPTGGRRPKRGSRSQLGPCGFPARLCRLSWANRKRRWLYDVQSAGCGSHVGEGVHATCSPAYSHGAQGTDQHCDGKMGECPIRSGYRGCGRLYSQPEGLARIIHEHFCCNRRSAATTSLRPAGSPLEPSTYCTSMHRVLTAPRAGLATRLSDFATNRHE